MKREYAYKITLYTLCPKKKVKKVIYCANQQEADVVIHTVHGYNMLMTEAITKATYAKHA